MPEQEPTDEQVVARIQNGEAEMFEVVVARYEPKLKRYASKFIKSHTDTEDLLQDVFIKAYRNIQSFDTSRKFSSWIYRIAHNEFINFIKKRRIETVPIFDTDIIIPYRQNFNEELDRADVKKILDQSLDKLDLKYSEPILLYYLEEFSYQEISDILHIPIATVGVRISRGKKILQESSHSLKDKYNG